MRTRTAANRAFSRPFVPLRQLTVLHLAPASISSAGVDRMSGTRRLAWLYDGFTLPPARLSTEIAAENSRRTART
jgi:hypothetical protein